jgi:hypothetical protein
LAMRRFQCDHSSDPPFVLMALLPIQTRSDSSINRSSNRSKLFSPAASPRLPRNCSILQFRTVSAPSMRRFSSRTSVAQPPLPFTLARWRRRVWP